MAVRASFTGTLMFEAGPFHVGIKAYTTVAENEPEFKTLHSADLAPIKQQYVCSGCSLVVGKEDQVKGVETEKGWLTFTEQEIAEASKIQDERIVIHQIVRLEEVNIAWHAKTYYLAPDSLTDARAYAVLLTALKKDRLGAAVTYIARNKDYIGLLEAGNENMLLLHSLVLHEDVRTLRDYDIHALAITPTDQEMKAATKLLASYKASFDHVHYTSLSRTRIRDMIQAKREQKPLPDAKVINLVESLKTAEKPQQQKKVVPEKKPAKRATQ